MKRGVRRFSINRRTLIKIRTNLGLPQWKTFLRLSINGNASEESIHLEIVEFIQKFSRLTKEFLKIFLCHLPKKRKIEGSSERNLGFRRQF